MSVQFYLRIPPCAPADQIAAFVRECEDAGFAGVGILDSPLLLRELFVTMTAAALATSRIRLATAVTNPATRQPRSWPLPPKRWRSWPPVESRYGSAGV